MPFRRMSKFAVILFVILGGIFVQTGPAAAQTATKTFTVNSPADVNDFDPGDGHCTTGLYVPNIRMTCTLRAAITEANAYLSGPETLIHIRLPANTYTLALDADNPDTNLGGDLDVNNLVKAILIEGIDPINPAVIQASDPTRVFEISGSNPVELKHLVITGGRVQNPAYWGDAGAGIKNSAPLTLTDVLIEDNQITCPSSGCDYAVGGGILNYGSLAIQNSTINYNRANRGSAIFNAGGSGPVDVENSTFMNNLAKESAAITNYALVTLVNSTVSANAGEMGVGGIYNNGSFSMANVTLANNYAPSGVQNFYNGPSATAILRNSIVASPGTARNCTENMAYSITSQGYNLFSDDTCVQGKTTGDVVNTDPLLQPLADNGGTSAGVTTWTQALQSGSAAIDGGNPSGCRDFSDQILATDQRGHSRTLGVCDKGAFEVDWQTYLPLILR